MTRYLAIQSAAFGQIELAGPRSVRLTRSAKPSPAGSDADRLATSVELLEPSLTVDLVVRDTRAAEALQLGQQDTLRIVLASDAHDTPARAVQVDDAVLTAVELHYPQTAPAEATLRFVTQPADGNVEPFSAEDLA
jgi:hypothetical protein